MREDNVRLCTSVRRACFLEERPED